jgi:SAM-dependent methyltransferase
MEVSEYKKLYDYEMVYWWFVGKRKIVKYFLDHYAYSSQRLRLLDIGCGTGSNLNLLEEYGEAIGMDSSKESIKFCRQRELSKLVLASAEQINFKDSSFDIVTALDLLEHIEKDELALSEIYRILKKHGHLIMTLPANMLLWSQHDLALHHKRRYERSELKRKVEEAGFSVDKMTYFNTTLFLPILIIRTLRRFIKLGRGSDVFYLPSFLNYGLFSLINFEYWLIKRLNLPFGVSLVCVASKS